MTLNWKPRFRSFFSIWEVMLSKPTWLWGKMLLAVAILPDMPVQGGSCTSRGIIETSKAKEQGEPIPRKKDWQWPEIEDDRRRTESTDDNRESEGRDGLCGTPLDNLEVLRKGNFLGGGTGQLVSGRWWCWARPASAAIQFNSGGGGRDQRKGQGGEGSGSGAGSGSGRPNWPARCLCDGASDWPAACQRDFSRAKKQRSFGSVSSHQSFEHSQQLTDEKAKHGACAVSSSEKRRNFQASIDWRALVPLSDFFICRCADASSESAGGKPTTTDGHQSRWASVASNI